jgi:thiol-disulfide isomerase/thioredoxin
MPFVSSLRSSLRGRLLAAAAVTALAVGLAACSNDPLASQYREGDNKGFIAGDFRVVEIPEAERDDAVQFAGVTESGDEVTSGDYAGDVLVVNFWYAACGPCIVEAPRLEEAFAAFDGGDVSFLGVNTYDQAETAASFARDNGVSYPSVIDVNDGTVKLAFAEKTPINATPTTLVLDRQGRVAARIIGELAESSILETLVRDTLAEES